MDEKVANKSTRGGKRPGSGRKKGVPNKLNTLLKDEILQAAGDIGEDGAGEGGLRGYLRHVAKTEPKSYASLIGRVLPLQVTGEGGGPVAIQFSTVYERAED